MSDAETEQLIATAQGELVACEQLVLWSQRLREALEARRLLLDVPPERLRSALGRR